VTVTATQGDKKAVATTDDQGLFTFANLADGTWTVTLEMTGFETLKQDVAIAPNAPIATFAMKLLTLDQIRAAAKPLKVENVPVLTASVPAAPTPASDASAAAPGKAAAPAAKGGAAKTQTQTASAAGPAAPGAADAAPPAPVQDPTAAQANDGFLINGSVNNAATSQFSMNQAFGNTRNSRSLYNYGLALVLDDSALDAKQYSITGAPVTNPSFFNFQGTATFGGPLRIKHLMPRGPNFFLMYQRGQQDTNQAAQAPVPTLAERAIATSGGNLAALTGQTIYAPTTLSTACQGAGVTPGAPFPGNNIPSACISSQAQYLLNLYPAPNVTNTIGPNNFQTVTTRNVRQDAYQLQMSKQFGSKNNVNGRFNLQNTRTGSNSLFGFHDATKALGMNSYVDWYHRITQRLSVDTNYSFSRQRTQQTPFFANRQNVEGLAGVTGVDTDPNYWGPPSLGFTSGIAGLSDGSTAYNRNETNSIHVEFDWNRFRHEIAGGGDFRRQEINILAQSNPRGSFSFNGTATGGGVIGGGSDFADFLLGVPDTSSISYGNADKYLRQSVYDLYIRDNFRVNPEFTINYGARWEYGAPITELKGRLVNLDIAPGFATEQPVVASSPVGSLTGTHYPSSMIQPDKSGIAPNVGIAWRPISGSSLLVRAGYQIAHDTSVYTSTAQQMATQHGTAATPLSTSLSLSNANCALTLAQGFNGCPSIAPDTFAVDPHFRVGYIQIWDLILQRDLPGSLQLIATYLGNKGTRGVQEFLPNSYAVGGTNPCPACTSGYLYRTSNGNSTRESGQIQLRRRLRSGFTANLSYIFSKSLDDDYSFGGSGGTAVNQQVAQDWRNPTAQRGLSTFDQRHVLTAQVQYTTGMGIHGGTLMSGWRGAIYKEWTVQATVNAASGLPETPIYSATVPGTGNSNIFRPNFTGAAIHAPTVGINPLAFALPAAGQFGNARRDSMPGPNQFSLNASMNRAFRMHDRYNLTTEIDANNVLNHVVYTGWYTTWQPLTNPVTGTATSPYLFGTPLSANNMRSVSINMRLRF
jgi:hypothetical protein